MYLHARTKSNGYTKPQSTINPFGEFFVTKAKSGEVSKKGTRIYACATPASECIVTKITKE